MAPDEDIQFGADLAAFFSKERDATKATVSYTSPKNVRAAAAQTTGRPLQTIDSCFTFLSALRALSAR